MTASKIDLHTHTTASDGLFSPSDLIKRASETGLATIAITDHDTTNGLKEAVEASQSNGNIEVIPGIEINTSTRGMEVHVLGYFIDHDQAQFQQSLSQLRSAREIRARRMVERLNEHNIKVDWERVRAIATGTIGRPHIAQALIENGYASSVADAFDKYLSPGQVGFVPRYNITHRDAVQLISSARGVPVIAHPAEIPDLDTLLPELIHLGLKGLEVYYGEYSDETVSRLKDLAEKYHLIATGGTDYHGPNIHPTPLGRRFVPEQAVTDLKAESARRAQVPPPEFELQLP